MALETYGRPEGILESGSDAQMSAIVPVSSFLRSEKIAILRLPGGNNVK